MEVSPSSAAVDVQFLDRATTERLGGVGAGFRLSPRFSGSGGSGPVTVSLSYASFQYAYGGNFADRLRLFAVASDGRRTAVPARNDLPGRRISAKVTPGSTTYLLTSTASGPNTGDYRATDLRPSGKWQAGLQAGSFTDSYPLDLPPAVGGEAPDLALGYDSSSVDGRTSATNNQASWAGLGWELGLGFIERRYKSCVDDGDPYHADLCWSSPYSSDEDGAAYAISLDGVSTELIRTSDGSYRMRDDQGWKIEHKYDGPNDDNTGEYWVVSTPDGDKHTLGYRKDSNFTVPVVGDDSGEPCHSTAPVPCRQSWRWGLDKIVDANENVTSVYWAKETNNYKQANGSATYKYDRAGSLDRVEYGGLDGEHPAAQVDFTTTPRCTQRVANPATACPAVSAVNASSYPDVPTDLVCADGASCSKLSPSFFQTSRLESLVSRVWDVSTNKWLDVSKWTPTFAFPPTPDGSSPVLWLNSIQRAGLRGTEQVTLPPVAFDGQFLINRQDWSSTEQQLQMRRLTVVRNGLGGETRATYGHANAATTCPNGQNDGWEAGVMWDQNRYECFRVRFKPEGASSPTKGVFNKYVVTKVDEVDVVGGSPTMTTAYAYGVNQLQPYPAWHRDDELGVPAADLDWTDWRGYETVRATEGAGGADRQTITDTRFFRGMNGDLLASGTPKPASLQDYTGVKSWPDDPQLAGEILQTQSWRKNADGSLFELESSRNTYWDSGIIADGPGPHDVRMVRKASTYSRDRRGDNSWRETSTLEDGYTVAGSGQPTRKVDFGETGVNDSTCTELSYARNTSSGNWILDPIEQQETHAGDPDSGTQCPGPVIGRTVNLYDGATATGAANTPTDGNVTEERSYTAESVYNVVKHAYDNYGREKSETTADGVTTTTYTPASGFPTGGVAVKDPAGFTETTYPMREFEDAPDRIVDVDNNNTTEFDYDGLGRLRKVWLPTEPSSGPASYEFTYRLTFTGTGQPTKPTVVTTKQLQALSGTTATWLPGYAYLDGFGRTREVQAPSPGPNGGRTVTVTQYDDRGLTKGTSAPMWNSTAAGDNASLLLNPATSAIPSWTEMQYDALEREATSTLYGVGTVASQTTTTNFGNGRIVTPPVGGRTATWLDGHDRDATIQQDVPAGATGPVTGVPTTGYAYRPSSEDVTTITDPAGNVTTYTYDWLGKRLTADDPDAGSSVSTYDAMGRVKTVTDAKGGKLSYTYDALGRDRTVWSGEAQSGTKLAEWTYDTVPRGKGEPASAVRYAGGSSYVTAISGYDQRGRVTGRRWTIPDTETGLAGTYDITYGYDRADHVVDTTYPAVGGLAGETVHQTFGATGLSSRLTSELGTYVDATSYTGAGQVDTRNLGAGGGVRRTSAYEPNGAQRLASLVTRTNADTATPTTVQNDAYSYDAAGNVRRVLDAVTGQSQCSTYDPMLRLSASWTTVASSCGGGVGSADNGGPDPFKEQYTYDATGNLETVTVGGTSRTYTYPEPGPDSVRPHAVSGIGSDRYGYDANGAMASRTVGGVASTYDYDQFGMLVKAESSGVTTSFGYDADGTRLVRHEPGASTLYLEGMEIRAADGAKTATRYYTVGDGDLVGQRNPAGVTWLLTDQQGSVQLAVDVDAVSRQRYLPYGARRGGRDEITTTDHGYLGKVEDSTTKLVALDNRQHDPAIGKLTSPDPIVEVDDPGTQNSYAYARDNPVTYADPTGLICDSARGDSPHCYIRPTYNPKNRKKSAGCSSKKCHPNWYAPAPKPRCWGCGKSTGQKRGQSKRAPAKPKPTKVCRSTGGYPACAYSTGKSATAVVAGRGCTPSGATYPAGNCPGIGNPKLVRAAAKWIKVCVLYGVIGYTGGLANKKAEPWVKGRRNLPEGYKAPSWGEAGRAGFLGLGLGCVGAVAGKALSD
ncbi:RHS repeat-associated core domain-containing protein [Flindersiella endophytica]